MRLTYKVSYVRVCLGRAEFQSKEHPSRCRVGREDISTNLNSTSPPCTISIHIYTFCVGVFLDFLQFWVSTMLVLFYYLDVLVYSYIRRETNLLIYAGWFGTIPFLYSSQCVPFLHNLIGSF